MCLNIHIISLPSSAIGTRVETRNSSILKTQHHQLRFSSSKSTVLATNSFSRIDHCKHLFITNILVHSLFIKFIESSLKSNLDSEFRDSRGRMTSRESVVGQERSHLLQQTKMSQYNTKNVLPFPCVFRPS